MILPSPAHRRLLLPLLGALFSVLLLASCSADDSYQGGFTVCEPACPRGSYLVTECQDQPECQYVESCDGSILACVPILSEPDAGEFDSDSDVCEELPSCPPSSEEISTCPEERFCTRVTVCGHSQLCLDPLAQCDTPPACPEGQVGDASCSDFDPDCAEVRHCDETFRCRRCEGLPTACPPDYEAIDPELCGEERPCDQVLTCEGYLSCAPIPEEEPCDEELVCPEGYEELDACTTEHPECQTLELCNETISCAPRQGCTTPASCPEGYERLDACTPEIPDCHDIDVCGEILACQLTERCTETPQCPEGTTEMPQERCSGYPICLTLEGCQGQLFYCGGD
ncbi:hypothetical protein DL240_17900 [Lujinxingia litoralis]|uniref:Dickkopf N-terminal cysteine-rich domain-containing protein n=1 Tax=Lujinxingia litoralis TaxID=2211119 RepID=A0A328C1G0_9DELT|nr:hypothetical protein [Lujinxingia litoralis]RAL20253.1 hypothetical protein DL240_17900 [Lujinxingia litoralis]